MNPDEDMLYDHDNITPSNSKKLKRTTDDQDSPLLATMDLDYETLLEGIEMSEQVTSGKVDVNLLLEDRKQNETSRDGIEARKETFHSPLSSSIRIQASNGGHEAQPSGQHPTSQNQDAVVTGTASIVAHSPASTAATKSYDPSLLESPDENRREALKGIVTGIPDVKKSTADSGRTEDDPLDFSQDSKVSSPQSHTPSSSKLKESTGEPGVIVKRRAPRKNPKPRMPLEQRVFYSKKELDSAAAFLEDKEDLCDVLPLDDCFLLGDMFWIFTVKQLELALDETDGKSTPSFVEEMIATFSRATTPVNTLNSFNTASSTLKGTTEVSELDRTRSMDIGNEDATKQSSQANKLVSLHDQQGEMTAEIKDITNDESSHISPLHARQDNSGSGSAVGAKEETNISECHTIASNEILHENSNIEPTPTDVPPDPQVAGTDGSHPLMGSYLDREAMIKKRISVWRKALESFRNDRTETKQLQMRFPLDGPVKILFPQATQNFFKSIHLETLWSFLGLRKSETGAICDLMHIWRRKCQMTVVPDIGLGRHFLAIAARIETVLTAFPPIPENDRGWILDPISGITGAARDFLIRDHKIMSGAEFLNFKTKQLADILEVWRHDNGMEKLRGSGKVAMISAWKACIKEALEVENNTGSILDLSRFVAMVQNEKNASTVTFGVGKTKHGEAVVKMTSSQEETSDLALHSKLALERVLGEGAAGLLRSGGVQTAADLFDVVMVSESRLYKALIATGIVDDMQAFVKAVTKWREMMRQSLSKLPASKNLNSLSTGASENKSPLKITNIARVVPSRVQNNLIPNSAISRPTKCAQTVQNDLSGVDPVYDVLSNTTKQFLASMGIFTAKEFLKSRSSTLAISFVPWRRSKGKPELKGLGSIASISGWKSQIRKKAKEIGLDDLAELEPYSRGTKKHLQSSSHQQEIIDANVLDSVYADDEIEIDKAQYGDRLATAYKELFAVHHQNTDCQSVFELSLRQSEKLIDQRKLYITFKGIALEKSSRTSADCVQTTIALETKQHTKITKPAWILPDIPVGSSRGIKIPGNNVSSVFFTSTSHVGLIDITLHGACPYQDQNLDLLMHAMETFVIKGHSVPLEGFAGSTEEIYNVMIRKVRLDTFQYLLYLQIPVEQGLTTKVIFPSIQTTFHLQSHMNSDYAIMHKIDESFMTVSVADLQELTTWLHEKLRVALPLGATDDRMDMYVETRVRRMRVLWLGRRLIAVAEQRMRYSDENPLNDKFCVDEYFSVEMESIDLSTQQKIDSAVAAAAQIEIELRCAMEPDLTCGSKGRHGWNSLANQFFDDVVSCVAECISSSSSEKLEWSPLLELIKSALENSDKPQGIRDDQMDISTETLEVVKVDGFSDKARVSEEISHDLMWQIVNSVFDALRMDLFVKREACILTSGLSLIKACLFDSDAIVQDPILIRYDQELSYVSPSPFRADIDYIPDTQMLFLGLVWPVLRKSGWQVVIGNSPNETAFIPKSVSRKRRSTSKLLRHRARVKLDCDLKNAGFDSIPKTAKRLLLAISSETIPEDWVDVTSDREFMVEDVLEKFQASLCGRFSTLPDFPKFKVNDIIREFVIAIGDCFDSCASMIVPIAGLSPRSSSHGESISRPITTYQCEYLIPFLFNFLSNMALHPTSDTDVKNADNEPVRGLACDLLVYLSEHHHELFEQRFQPPPETYIDIPTTSLWIVRHINSLSSESVLLDRPALTAVADVILNENKGNNEKNGLPTTEFFEVLLDDEKEQVTDFVRLILENTNPFFAVGNDTRRKSSRPIGTPGLVCRHCLGKHGEGKYFFSSSESLSTCYPVLEKHYYKCPDAPVAVKEEIAQARALHIQQRRLKPTGSQQAVFVKLWNRMVQCRPDMAQRQKLVGASSGEKANGDNTNYVVGKNKTMEVDNDDDAELVFHDHRAVIDYLRSDDTSQSWSIYTKNRTLSQSSKEEIEDVLDTYYACIDFAGRVYGTSSMPLPNQHFSTQWLLHKMNSGRQSQEEYRGASTHNIG